MFFEILATSTLSVPTPATYELTYSKEWQTVSNHNLSTQEGRIEFLEHKLTPFIIQVDQLNIEIQALSKTISESDENAREEVLNLCNELTAKMETMSTWLPILEKTMLLESDFEQLEGILSKSPPLQPFEEEVLQRVASLCDALDSL